MKKKKGTKKYFVFAVLLLIVAGLLGFYFYQNPTVKAVDGLAVTNVDTASVSLEWKSDEVDGYYLYQQTGDESKKIATISNATKTEYTIEDLDSAEQYTFFVNSYVNRINKVIESEEHKTVDAFTLPAKQKIKKVSADEERQIVVKWTANDKADGYQIQYVKGDTDDFSSATTIDIEKGTKTTYTIKKLGYNKHYSVRVRTYSMFQKERVYGAWSDIKIVKTKRRYVQPSNIDPKKPMIALTFDDGPGYNNVSDRILDVLEKYNVKATFFMVGQNAANQPKNLKRKVKLGMEIGNHTQTHAHYGNNVTKSDIKKASDAIYKACGVYPTAFRSPGGNTTKTILNECKAEKMPLYYWSIDTLDWKNKNADAVYKAVMKNVKDGDIILMHELYPSTAKAVEKMVPALLKKGYQLVTCEQLIYAKTGKAPKAGQQYVNADTIRNNTN